MKLTKSQEEYLKTIYILLKNGKNIGVTKIANRLQITKPSVNRAIKNLRELYLIKYKTYGEITLTDEGEKLAKSILKRQDILKIFFTEILEIEEKQAEEEAKVMKYALSEETEKRLDAYISRVLNLDDLECNYNSDNEKCRSCARISAKNRSKGEKR